MEVLAVSVSRLVALQRLWSCPQGLLSLGALAGKRMLFKYVSYKERKYILGKETSGREERDELWGVAQA